jgi:hypothetical protein
MSDLYSILLYVALGIIIFYVVIDNIKLSTELELRNKELELLAKK